MQRGYGAQQCLQHLAGKHAPKVSFDAIGRDGDEDEQQAQQEADHTEQKGLGGLAESVQDAVKGAGDIHERADET